MIDNGTTVAGTDMLVDAASVARMLTGKSRPAP